MRKLFTFMVAVFLTATLWAQSPEKMSYQAVIRNSSEALVTNTTVGMQISILQGSASGTAVYVETQSPTTNANGLVSLEIGVGTVVSGDFATIDWANGPYFIKTETAVEAPLTTYTITGTSQLLSVPYALHAKTAATVTGAITETDPTFTSSEAANIDANDITNLSNLSGVNTGDQDLSTLATKTALGDSTAQVRSKIPDVSGFLTTETDPTFTSSQAANIDANDITNLSNLSGVNTGDQDLSTLATKTALGDSTAQVRSEIPDVSGFLTTETDPTFTSSQAANIDANDITNLSNLSGVNTGDQDLSTLATKTALGDSTAQVRSEIPDVSGFLTTETDPTFTSSQAANIDANDITNLSNLSGVNTGDQDLSTLATKTALGDSTAQVRSEIPDVSGFLTTETDPTFTSSQAANIDANDITNLSNLSGVNTGDQDLSTLATKTALGDSTAQVRSEIPDVSGFLTTETDPTFTSSQAANIDANDITNLSNLSGVNTGDQDGSETKVTAGTNVTITGAGTTASPYVVNSTAGGSSLAIGDSYQGGIIFWLDATGQHGLIAATADQSTGIQWYNGTFTVTNAVRDGIGAGMYNTERIIANQSTGSYAAQLCANYQGGGYGDWYLPSKYELNLLYLQKTAVGGFASAYYWSSTENDLNSAWTQNFGNGSQDYDYKDYANRVRAVRAF
jgi:hypothetical protein